MEDLKIRDNGESLTIEGDLDDLDDLDDDCDVTVILRARGDAQYRCERPGHDRRDGEEVKLSGNDTSTTSSSARPRPSTSASTAGAHRRR